MYLVKDGHRLCCGRWQTKDGTPDREQDKRVAVLSGRRACVSNVNQFVEIADDLPISFLMDLDPILLHLLGNTAQRSLFAEADDAAYLGTKKIQSDTADLFRLKFNGVAVFVFFATGKFPFLLRTEYLPENSSSIGSLLDGDEPMSITVHRGCVREYSEWNVDDDVDSFSANAALEKHAHLTKDSRAFADFLCPTTFVDLDLPSSRNVVYCECVSDGVIVQPEGRQMSLNEVKQENSEFRARLDRLASETDGGVVKVYVHADGGKALMAVSSIAADLGLVIKYEPIYGNRRVVYRGCNVAK